MFLATWDLNAIKEHGTYVHNISRLAVVSHEAKKKQQARALQDYVTTTVSNLHAQ